METVGEETHKSYAERFFGFLRSLIPRRLIVTARPLYHRFVAYLAAFLYRHPSRSMLVIGVTGTKGKTSTANFIWSCFQNAGYQTGLVSTANIRIGKKEIMNPYHMTTPGRFVLQKLLRDMVRQGCTHCVLEITSEGINQFRHKGIDFDGAIFTNLSPEHLPSHGGSFEKYREAKGKLFATLKGARKKNNVPKVIVVNNNDAEHEYFLSFWAEKKITYGLASGADVKASNIEVSGRGMEFLVGETPYHTNVWGRFQIPNALAAIACARAFGVIEEKIQKGIELVKSIPGRMEWIEAGQDFFVLVDYAHEATSMNAALSAARELVGGDHNVIILLGAEGGGRDKRKRPLMGEAAGRLANYVVVSAVDPYDDDPTEIIESVAIAAEQAGKVRDENLFCIENRREAIQKALSLAGSGDVVVLAGKGSEQSMYIYGKKLFWDDRIAAREELQKLLAKNH